MIMYFKNKTDTGRSKDVEYEILTNGCWNCTSHYKSEGRTRVTINGYKDRLYRHVYREFKGEIPEGLMIRHLCNNPYCINPEHLEAGTHQDNMNDVRKAGTQAKENNPMWNYEWSEEQRKERSRLMKRNEKICKKVRITYPDGKEIIFNSVFDAEEKMNVTRPLLRKIAKSNAPYVATRKNVKHIDGIKIEFFNIGEVIS